MHSSRRSRSRSPHRDDRGRDRSRSRERDRERADRRDRDRERDRDRDRAPRDSDRARDGHQGDRVPESKEQKKEKALDALVLAPSSKRPIDLSQPFDIPPWAIQPELKHAVLAVFKDAEAVQAVQLGAKAVITFGRNKEQCDEALSHGSISRQHAAIIHALDGINVVDLKSSHGTTVNGEKLAPGVPRVLKDGDTIVFGASSRKYVVRLNVNEEDANKLVLPTGVDKAAVDKKRAEKRAREKEEHDKRASSKHDKSKAQESDSKNKRHKDQGQKGETVSARHLLLKHVNSRKPQAKGVPITRTEEEAIRLIQEYRRQIVQTAEDTKRPLLDVFGEYATQYSDCSSSTRGGDLGEFGRGKMNPPFEAASFALPVGGLSEVVMTSSGAHLILRTG